MFTGIIEQIGRVTSFDEDSVTIAAPVMKSLHLGQSLSVNGVCLTLVKKNKGGGKFEIMRETFRRTNLSHLKKSSLVNLERSLSASGRYDGHIVQGHVEGVARIYKIIQGKNETEVLLRFEKKYRHLLKYMIVKGIVIGDGIALTITTINDSDAEIMLALTPYTWENTNLRTRKRGDLVNIETDYLAKMLERLHHFKKT